MYLHGGSRRGDDIEKLREPGFGLKALVEKDKSFPFIVLSPQCREGEYWTDTEALVALLDEVESKYQVDPARVYLTGHSMGGFGTWYLAYKYPERFTAIAPMSAPFTVTAWAARLKDMPIWAFHGAKDSLVPMGGSEELIDALRSLGNDVRFTVLSGRDHDILDAYKNQELYGGVTPLAPRTARLSSLTLRSMRRPTALTSVKRIAIKIKAPTPRPGRKLRDSRKIEAAPQMINRSTYFWREV